MRGREVRWIVQAGDGPRLGAVLERLGAVADGALEQGRVFVGKQRAISADRRVEPGDVVAIRAERRSVPERLCVLDRRDGLIAVEKPAALPTEPDARGGAASLRALLARQLGVAESELHAAGRLDVGVSGLVLFACDARARTHVARLRDAGELRRRYVAIAAGRPDPENGRWEAPVEHRGKSRSAVTDYRTVAVLDAAPGRLSPPAQRVALLALDPLTGRTHQLRQHAARGAGPLLGDRRYGGAERLRAADGSVHPIAQVLLHAARLELRDPGGAAWVVRSEPGAELALCWRALGGQEADLMRAAEVVATSG